MDQNLCNPSCLILSHSQAYPKMGSHWFQPAQWFSGRSLPSFSFPLIGGLEPGCLVVWVRGFPCLNLPSTRAGGSNPNPNHQSKPPTKRYRRKRSKQHNSPRATRKNKTHAHTHTPKTKKTTTFFPRGSCCLQTRHQAKKVLLKPTQQGACGSVPRFRNRTRQRFVCCPC